MKERKEENNNNNKTEKCFKVMSGTLKDCYVDITLPVPKV